MIAFTISSEKKTFFSPTYCLYFFLGYHRFLIGSHTLKYINVFRRRDSHLIKCSKPHITTHYATWLLSAFFRLESHIACFFSDRWDDWVNHQNRHNDLNNYLNFKPNLNSAEVKRNPDCGRWDLSFHNKHDAPLKSGWFKSLVLNFHSDCLRKTFMAVNYFIDQSNSTCSKQKIPQFYNPVIKSNPSDH